MNGTAYAALQIKREHEERLAEYNAAAPLHALYSMPCETCGRTFVGTDWRLAYKPFCSEACELKAYGAKLNLRDKQKIKLFWRDIGKDFQYLEYSP